MKAFKWVEVDDMIIRIMSGKFWNNYWHGYDSLKDELWSKFECSITEGQVNYRVKALRKDGKLRVKPIFSEGTGLLNGSGYFYKEPKMGTFDGRIFRIGTKLTSKENGELIEAPEGTPNELIVGTVR